ncbi:hypothetical protein ACTNEY_09060 [Fusicatenibacter saccharivorans]|uniref:hypothetical protein n=1 Tax=Fusicatenibacter saccharivorans TaxID=1150298 RepID=UPI0015A68F27|nr:hypothetical protein [Fusicatenibacter saccharivorans]MDY5073707.1 hypothetical protein [Fusicatenibacter saccharivorans]
MAYVAGRSESVRGLQELLNKTMKAIDANLGELDSALKVIRGGFRDEGVQEMEDAVKSISSAVEESKVGEKNVENALEAYASYLESIGK